MRRTIIALVVGLSVALLPVVAQFSAASTMDSSSMSECCPDQGMPCSQDDGLAMAACALQCLQGPLGIIFTGFDLVAAFLPIEPAPAGHVICPQMDSPPFHPPKV